MRRRAVLSRSKAWKVFQEMVEVGVSAPPHDRASVISSIMRKRYGFILPASWKERMELTALRLIAWIVLEMEKGDEG